MFAFGARGVYPFRCHTVRVRDELFRRVIQLSGAGTAGLLGGNTLFTNIRRADASVGRLSLLVRICVALAVALLSVPLLTASPTFAEDGDGTSTEAPTPAPDPTPAPEPAPAPEEPTATSGEATAEQPATEAPAEEAPAEPAAEQPAATAPTTKTKNTATVQAAPTAGGDCAASFSQNTQEDHGGSWINGALNQNNSNYAEGDYVPQKVELSGLTPGTHTLTFSYDRTKNGKYAYDFVDYLSISGSAGASVSWDAEAPNPPMPFAVTVFVTIEFTIVANDPTATLIWEGHIASELDYGPNSSAGTISGAPYHFSLVDMSCGNVGQQDNQLMADAVDFGTITIVKDAQPNDAQDFHFTLAAPNNLNTAFDLDDDADGTLPNSVTYHVPPGVTTAAEVNIALGWTLSDITCIKSGAEVGTPAGTGISVTLADNDFVTCTFLNSRESSLEVDKYWVINNGTPVQEGSEPANLDLGAQLTVNGGNQFWNTSIGGFLQGAGVTLNESVTFGNPLCDWAGATHGSVTEANGQTPANGALAFSDTLGGGSNHYTITNTVTCHSNLTLVKDVSNGPALASAWTLSATPVDGSDLAFASGSTGVSHAVTADSDYQLDENDADSRYNQVGPWTCTQYGSVTTVNNEQRVSVEAGRSATCTVVNATAVLVLRKVVQNPNGGTAVPGDFTLVASPQSGGADLSTPGSGAGTSYFVDPDEVFDLSETGGPFGYTLTGINCGNGPVTSVQVPVSTTVTCTFTNVDSPGSLTLDKIVDDNGTGDSTPETAWHLSATPLNIANQPTIEGDGGATGATKAGTYQLAESGPATHTPGIWSCKDDADNPVTVSALDQITLAASQIVFCEITNTAITPQLTLIKQVDPGSTGDTTGPDAFTLFAIPDGIVGQGTVSGPGPQVDADVMVGTYTLDEDGPATYEQDAAGWTCTDAQDNPVPVSAADQFSIGLAEHITCEVTNNAIPSSWRVTKSSVPPSGSTVSPGDQIQYTITVEKIGDGVDVLDFNVVDTLTGIDMSWVSNILVSNGLATPGVGVINWHIDQLSDTATLTYTVTVGQVFGATLRNAVTPGPTPCVDPVDDDPNIIDCDETTHFTPHFVLDKDVSFDDADNDGLAEPGQVLTYKLSMTNDTTNATVEDAVVTDNLLDVLDNGSIVETAAELAAKGLVLNVSTLTWTVASLAPGATIEVTYQVLIADHQWGVTLHNVATPEPNGPGECVDEGECETTTETPPVTTMVVEKQNLETQEVLAGATFQLWLDNDNAGGDPETGDCTFPTPPVVGAEDDLLGTEVTGANGQVTFDELQKGCYLLVESEPPPGYDLPETHVLGVAINDANFVKDGLMATIVITDFAQGHLAILAKRQFEFVDSKWVPSDGKVDFGDVVKYEVEIEAEGPRLFHDVKLTDWVPGYNPDDVRTTLAGTLVGDPSCVGTIEAVCNVTVGDDNLITWDLGTFSDASGFVTFVARFGQLPDALDLDPNEVYTARMWNQGYLDWDELSVSGPVARGGTAVAAPVMVHQTRASNEVEVEASFTQPPILPPPPNPPLPNTGAQAYLTQLALLGGLVLALGVALLGRSRRKDEA
jgi:fimbrial isopeptide formation D2 family protein/LPXTG-motif cell wall-anchored protein